LTNHSRKEVALVGVRRISLSGFYSYQLRSSFDLCKNSFMSFQRSPSIDIYLVCCRFCAHFTKGEFEFDIISYAV